MVKYRDSMDCGGWNRIRIAPLEDNFEVLLTGKLAANLIAHFNERDILHLLDLAQVCPETHHATNLEWLQSCHKFLVDLGETVNMTDKGVCLPAQLVRKPRHKGPCIGGLTGHGRHSVRMVVWVLWVTRNQYANFL